ncbi:hypothetical protein KNP414_02398 [Paenibacillus mucilaginosus KNP414]|uniref:Uncharacterized protein n=1 Tax=Paenibacillus mucilaginosus (strain KNP414) TaxID=1036673 RepID=F8F5E8_PAEMK|nr:hypothetical protein KNP414_02398 [Paenibacillus mucilaginosus KNP414]
MQGLLFGRPFFYLKLKLRDLLAGKEMEWIVDYEVGFPKELEP